jgi:isoprenylcysteine carboxyl methyltransferase (ICMT) family protein YpbQ
MQERYIWQLGKRIVTDHESNRQMHFRHLKNPNFVNAGYLLPGRT